VSGGHQTLKILIANPNTSHEMLALMLREARQACRPSTEIAGIAAELGVAQIGSRSELAIAGYALLDGLARHLGDHDAVVIGAFYHAFVPAARELLPIPVVGLAEAAMRAAQVLGTRVSIIGLGKPGRGMNEAIVEELGMSAQYAGSRFLPLTGAALVADQRAAESALIEAGLAAVREDGADVLVLGGAAFAGMAPRVAPRLPVPVVSGVHYAVGYAEITVLSGWKKPTAGAYAAPDAKSSTGLAPELAQLFPKPPG